MYNNNITCQHNYVDQFTKNIKKPHAYNTNIVLINTTKKTQSQSK